MLDIYIVEKRKNSAFAQFPCAIEHLLSRASYYVLNSCTSGVIVCFEAFALGSRP